MGVVTTTKPKFSYSKSSTLVLAETFGLVAAGGCLLSGAIATLIALGLNRELARRLD